MRCQAFFLAETLKYLYLLFSERDVYPSTTGCLRRRRICSVTEPRCDRAACVGLRAAAAVASASPTSWCCSSSVARQIRAAATPEGARLV